ncbi:HD domain-containing protein [Francisella adeliensis]|uniref:HD domain-containing protein n=1 Tax=Francisella adeliensis TaxID=2007306 RepID=A0A2Z4XWH1_9GAMM|nr:HD domain-containing protein [Francisella adeliensis]AXA33211.1 hydrolase [Francisella adeliensis]MBK2085068.1 HD domain-containing protein [Francisella adeliensis]MBK2096941.1 HD domain-containing protein [Francisella adeliensis]QIW11439.1 HD domain-containing protein [Francisella adeliensis]QIW13314.1 HD domain-containing protein [Francisella adeliensis]
MNNLDQQVKFIVELEKLKSVYRKTWIPCDNNRNENTAEHSWQVALVANILSEYASVEINIAHVTKMLLLHDIVEIYAGDTFAFASNAILAEQQVNELKALDRLLDLLPKDQRKYFKDIWLEYEEAKTNDAKFANAIDRIVPAFQSFANAGGTWKKFNVSKTKILQRNKYLKEVAPRLYEYLLEKIDSHFEGDYYK